MNKYRSHNCSELTESDSGKKVLLSGWLHRKRDHGNLLFIDLRDHFGISQCVIENNNKYFKELENLKPESVISVSGIVKNRENGTENKDLKTEVLDAQSEPHNVISLVYDAERMLRIYHSVDDGLVICRGKGLKERPVIQIDTFGTIKISTDAEIFLDASDIFLSNDGKDGKTSDDVGSDDLEPVTRGGSLQTFLEHFIADYKAHIHPTGVGPSSTLQVPFVELEHITYQQKGK